MIIAPPTKVPIPGTSCRSRKLIRVDSSGERNIKFATSLVFSAYVRAFAQRIQPTALEMIARYSKDFGGTLSDAECIKLIGIARNTYYKYKRELREQSAGLPPL